MKRILSALFLITLSGVAAAASVDNSRAPNVENYTYSTPLKIAKVVNISNGDYCGIGTREMTYIDTSNVTHTLRYQAFGDSCIDQN
ncbi:DUF2790 domain-containing protein [Pseudomonas arsenicoxydans]|uniref:DUF2790 domain-containing protein n=1 Tax=Pseudomonas arsenicoxydans TaxID=702115 RepID=A0A4P6G4G6_9PSED|nr:DUF2790 domain-containing protein [Pseudomonas arsenicoxydans]QAY86393.1 DUF2790 domain-containing protein [Pseudomonas arsenicoxydans]